MEGFKKVDEYREVISKLSELKNLKALYESGLEKMATFCGPVGRNFNSWDVRRALCGIYYTSPWHKWIGKVVTIKDHPEYGQGIIVAVKNVGGIYFPGVEFDTLMEFGHGLEDRTEGIPGRDGYCLWFWLDTLLVVEDQTQEDKG